ncbi:TonB-dependent receptor [Novosphingobium pokkalii]|uniref:TonB-dependent receptor n=2 Tax=Novosphingobium pokkalii TaxID=1770194 RepID=A0ABV7V309_9SPHN|nr:TonB-dependent receptor [Novosphingobium pokkalii]GHC83386.1 hypothetical protein GCM10019060_02850 [Novosphingobium pokkalii]
MSERGNLALARAMARAHGRSAGSHASSLAIALALAISGGAPALAQTQPQSTPAQTTPAQTTQTQDSGPADIVVTAFKRAETSLKVPAAIAVLGGNDLRTVGVNSVNDVQNLVPGVVIGNGAFGTNVTIRGVTSSDQTSKGELGIAFNIDGAFIGRGQEQGVAFFDIDRVEVLRGPQGTLYGRSSTGGAINVITKKPVLDRFEGYVRVEAGNYDTRRAEAAINVPITPVLAVRLAGNVNDRDGFLRPVDTTVSGATGTTALSAAGQPAKGDQKDRTGRFSILFKPSDDLSATLVATVGHIGGVGPGGALLSNLNAGGSKAFEIVPNPIPSWQDQNFANFNGQLTSRMGAVQLDVLGAYQHFSARNQITGNANPYDTGSDSAPGVFLLDQYTGRFNTTQFEARLSNAEPGVVDYVVGANYYYEKIHESDHNWKAPVDTWTDTSTWITAIDPVNTTTHKSYGVFGQATVHLSDKIGLIGGLRYSNNENGRVGTFAVNVATADDPSCTYPNDCIGGPNSGTEKDHKVTWKVGLNYQADPANLFYASIATGFKAGGFNDYDPATGKSVVPYGPESMTAYEIGYKGRPLPGLTFTSSAYYYDYAKDQINGLALFVGSAGVTGVLYTQLAPVEIYGWENEARYQVDRNTAVSLGVAYAHSRIRSLKTGYLGYLTGVFADWAGYRLPNLPSITVNGSITHNVDLANGAQVRLRLASKYSSSYLLSDYANAVQYRQSPFTRSDASVTYATDGDQLTVQLFVENIENKLQKTFGPNGYNGAYGGFTGSVASAETNGTSFPVGSVNFSTSLPRLYGVRLAVKF